jgi:hypothetical protein
MVFFVMAWSPFRRSNAGISWVEHPGEYANRISTTPAPGPKLKAAGVYDATYAEALATELRRLVCTGNADAIYIFRGLVDSCFWRVLQLRADGSPLLRELKREAPSLVDYITSENCPLAASLTNGEKEMLLAIKQAAAQDSAPPPASQKDK